MTDNDTQDKVNDADKFNLMEYDEFRLWLIEKQEEFVGRGEVMAGRQVTRIAYNEFVLPYSTISPGRRRYYRQPCDRCWRELIVRRL